MCIIYKKIDIMYYLSIYYDKIKCALFVHYMCIICARPNVFFV